MNISFSDNIKFRAPDKKIFKMYIYKFRGSNSFLPPFSIGVNSKRKEFAPFGANYFF